MRNDLGKHLRGTAGELEQFAKLVDVASPLIAPLREHRSHPPEPNLKEALEQLRRRKTLCEDHSLLASEREFHQLVHCDQHFRIWARSSRGVGDGAPEEPAPSRCGWSQWGTVQVDALGEGVGGEEEAHTPGFEEPVSGEAGGARALAVADATVWIGA